MRIPALIADIAVNITLYLAIFRQRQKDAILWGALYAINPVSILITSFHGNITVIPTLFTFLAYIVLLNGVQDNYRLSALLLGLAIGFRSYPILLLPFFILIPDFSLTKKIKYAAYALVPTFLSFVPFLLLNPGAVAKEVLSYSGWADHGFVAILRAVYSFKTGLFCPGLVRFLCQLLVL